MEYPLGSMPNRHRTNRALFLAALASGAACASPLSPAELLDLAAAEARWESRGFANYAIEERQSCFCPSEVAQWARLEVVNGTVVRVVVVESGAEIPQDQFVLFRTVEQVFDDIRGAADYESVADVVAAYDASLGFPTRVDLVPRQGLVDAGLAIYLRNATPIP